MIIQWSNAKYAGQGDPLSMGLYPVFNWACVVSAVISLPGGICQQVDMHPAIQQRVAMGGAIQQYVDMRPAIQQTATMGCLDGC
jgi:heme exporter protein D